MTSSNSFGETNIQKEQYPFITTKISNSKSTTVVECSYGGEYSVNDFIKAGTYIVTSDKSCLITFTDNNNTIIDSDFGSLIVIIPTAGKYRIHVSVMNSVSTSQNDMCHRITVAPVFTKPISKKVINDFVCISSMYTTNLSGKAIQNSTQNEVPFISNETAQKDNSGLFKISNVFAGFETSSSRHLFFNKTKLNGKLQYPFSQTGRVKSILAFILARKSRIAVSGINTT